MSFILNSGELRHPITIQRRGRVKDEDGRLVDGWVNLFSAKAKIVNVRGDEYLLAQGAGVSVTTTFYIRYNEKLTTSDRIMFNGEFYDIKYANNIEHKNRHYELKCELKS